MKRFLDAFEWLSATGTQISFVAMIAAVVVQVFSRFLLPGTPNWTEEAARIFFIYMVAFGTGPAIRSDAFVRLDFIRQLTSDRSYHLIQLAITLVVMLFSALMIYFSWRFTQLGAIERSPALLMSMSWIFFSVVIMMLNIFVFSLEKFSKLVSESRP